MQEFVDQINFGCKCQFDYATFCGQDVCPRELQDFMDPCSKSSRMHVPECHARLYGLICIMYVPQYCARFYDSVFMCTRILYKTLWTHVVRIYTPGNLARFCSLCMQSIVQDFADCVCMQNIRQDFVSQGM